MKDNVKTIALIDGAYLDAIGISSRSIAEKIREHYGNDCEIRIYREAVARIPKEKFGNKFRAVQGVKAPQMYREYDSSYKLVIDAVVARDSFDIIIIVSGDRNFLQICPTIHDAGKKIVFVLPDEQTDTNFFRLPDNVLDLSLENYVMEVI